MKTKNLLTAIALMTTLTSWAGGDVGNGGSGDESQLAAQEAMMENVSNKIKLFFIQHGKDIQGQFPEFQTGDLVRIIKSAEIRIVNNTLTDRHGKTRTCLNYASSHLIECNYKELLKIENDPKALFVLNLHEHLGLLEVEETSPENPSFIDGYAISKRIAPYITKVNDYDLRLNLGDSCTRNLVYAYAFSGIINNDGKDDIKLAENLILANGGNIYADTRESVLKNVNIKNLFEGTIVTDARSKFKAYISYVTYYHNSIRGSRLKDFTDISAVYFSDRNATFEQYVNELIRKNVFDFNHSCK